AFWSCAKGCATSLGVCARSGYRFDVADQCARSDASVWQIETEAGTTWECNLSGSKSSRSYPHCSENSHDLANFDPVRPENQHCARHAGPRPAIYVRRSNVIVPPASRPWPRLRVHERGDALVRSGACNDI